MRRNYRFYIAPNLNPDGYIYTWLEVMTDIIILVVAVDEGHPTTKFSKSFNLSIKTLNTTTNTIENKIKKNIIYKKVFLFL